MHWVAKELTCADQDRAYDEECDRPLVKESKSKVVDADLTHAQKDFGRSLGDADRGRHGSSTRTRFTEGLKSYSPTHCSEPFVGDSLLSLSE